MIKERRPCLHVCSRCCDHMCAELCMTCAASGIQGSRLLAATLRSVQGGSGIVGPRPGSGESSIFCISKAPWHPRSTSPSFGLVAKRLTRCTGHRSRAGAEDGDHVGPGRAGGAPARQDVVFHIKGVGALGRAAYSASILRFCDNY